MTEKNIKHYKEMINFLSLSMANDTQILLYSLETNESYILIEKSMNSTEIIGSALNKNFVESINNHKNKNNFLSKLSKKDESGRISVTSIYFIKENKEKLVGVFCIKKDITDIITAANYLNNTLKFITGGPERNIENEITRKDQQFEDTIDVYSKYIINEYFKNIPIPVEAMSINDKKNIVKTMNKKGIFQIKGNINCIAKKLKISEKTIYRYLND